MMLRGFGPPFPPAVPGAGKRGLRRSPGDHSFAHSGHRALGPHGCPSLPPTVSQALSAPRRQGRVRPWYQTLGDCLLSIAVPRATWCLAQAAPALFAARGVCAEGQP